MSKWVKGYLLIVSVIALLWSIVVALSACTYAAQTGIREAYAFAVFPTIIGFGAGISIYCFLKKT